MKQNIEETTTYRKNFFYQFKLNFATGGLHVQRSMSLTVIHLKNELRTPLPHMY